MSGWSVRSVAVMESPPGSHHDRSTCFLGGVLYRLWITQDTYRRQCPGLEASNPGHDERILAQLERFGGPCSDLGQELGVVIEATAQGRDHLGEFGFPPGESVREATAQQFDHDRCGG